MQYLLDLNYKKKVWGIWITNIFLWKECNVVLPSCGQSGTAAATHLNMFLLYKLYCLHILFLQNCVQQSNIINMSVYSLVCRCHCTWISSPFMLEVPWSKADTAAENNFHSEVKVLVKVNIKYKLLLLI